MKLYKHTFTLTFVSGESFSVAETTVVVSPLVRCAIEVITYCRHINKKYSIKLHHYTFTFTLTFDSVLAFLKCMKNELLAMKILLSEKGVVRNKLKFDF